jgi:hypothetical protein
LGGCVIELFEWSVAHTFPEIMHNFTGLEPVENIVEGGSRLAQVVGWDEVTAEDVTDLLDYHGQQLSNEDFEELDKEVSQQNEEEKEEGGEPVKSLKTSYLQHILSAMETMELCEIDHNWEQTAKVKKSAMVFIGPYSEILKEGNKEMLAVSTACFLQKRKDPQLGTSSEKQNFCIT